MEKTTLESLPALYLWCYAYGHSWDSNGGVMLAGGWQEDEFRCDCGTTKREVWSVRTRETFGRATYKHPKGYRLGYRITRENAKQEIRRRDNFKQELIDARRGKG